MNERKDYAVLILHADGTIENVPLACRDLDLQFLRDAVHGWVEIVRCNLLESLDPFLAMVVDEEGLLKDSPKVNYLASALYMGENAIVGDVVIGTTERDPEEEPDVRALSALQAAYLEGFFSDLNEELKKAVGAGADSAAPADR